MKKYLILALIVLLITGPVFATDYYVNTSADPGGDGTTQELTGANCAWDAIADVSAASLGADDNVYFNRGDTWQQEQLVVPDSGTSGQPITFGAYGTGNLPIINPSKIYSSWTEETEEIVLDKSTELGGGKVFSVDGNEIVGQGQWASDADYVISAFEIGVNVEWGTFSQNMVAEIYTMNGAALGNVVDTSDELLVDAVGTKKFVGMSASLSNGVDYALVVRRADTGFHADNCLSLKVDTGGDTWDGEYCTYKADKSRSGLFATWEMGVKLFQAVSNRYYAGYTGEPRQVFWDGDLLTENEVSLATLATGEWWNDETNNRIYVYDNPSGHVVEGSYWGRCIYTNNESYLTFENLKLIRSDWDNIWIDTASGTFDDIIIQDCVIEQAFNSGIGAGAGGFGASGEGVCSGLSILNNDFSKNGLGAGALGEATGFAINIAGQGPDDYIEDVLVEGNTVDEGHAGFKGDWFSNDITFRKNTIEVTGTAFSCDGGQGITWENNIIDGTNADHGGYAFAIFRWEGAPGPPFGFAIDNCKILNNVVYGYKKGVSLTDDQIDTIIKNNIFYSDFADNVPIWMEGGETRTGLDIDNNCYYTGAHAPVFTVSGVDTYNYAEWQAEGHDASSVNSDPLMTDPASDDFTTPYNSPCIDAGAVVGLTEDYLGLKIRHAPDIGIHENQTNALFHSVIVTLRIIENIGGLLWP